MQELAGKMNGNSIFTTEDTGDTENGSIEEVWVPRPEQLLGQAGRDHLAPLAPIFVLLW